MISNVVQKLPEKGSGNRVRVVFVFDECRVLLNDDEDQSTSAFACMRRAARSFPDSMGLAVVILDTVSRVSNLSPHSALDPSYRPRTMDSCKLFSPLYILPTIDHFATLVNKGDKLDTLLEPTVLYKYGRPLWGALMSSNIKLF